MWWKLYLTAIRKNGKQVILQQYKKVEWIRQLPTVLRNDWQSNRWKCEVFYTRRESWRQLR